MTKDAARVWIRRAVVALAALAACFVAFVIFVAIYEENVGRPQRGARVGCRIRLHQIGILLSIYAREHDGTLPRVPEEVVSNEEVQRGFLRCPGRKATYHGVSLGPEIPYVYAGAGMQTLAVKNPARAPIMFDAVPIHS